jgi:pimeloyl-ACP methyl ester carboxylesterase
MKHVLALLAALALAGCNILGSPKDPIHTVAVPGTEPGRALVVVLTGFADDAYDLQERGVADAIHRGWPAVDVLLVSATFPYYRTGQLVPQLEKHVMGPARARGYREIWLAGGSMGGMGALLYEWTHPGEVTGLVLVSPFLGDSVLDEIRAVGLAKWEAGELAPQMDGDNYERHVWNMIKGWRARPQLARRVWLACGTDDRLFGDVQVLAPEVPREQYLTRPGGHTWAYWIPAIEDMFRRVAASRRERG